MGCGKIWKNILIFALTMGILCGLLVCSAAIPNEAIRENMTGTARHYLKTELYSFEEDGRLRNVTDNRADQLLVNVAWHMGDSPVAVLDTAYRDGGFGMSMGLLQSVTADAPADRDYSRYWHGTAAFVRLAHLVTDIQGMKALGFAAIVLLAVWNLVLLWRRGHGELALCLGISLVAVQFWNLRLSITYQPCFLLAFLLCPAFLRAEAREKEPPVGLCIVSGAATAFFDFLTTETVPLLVPLILVTAIRWKKGGLPTLREAVAWVLPCVAGWLAAYGAAFLLKWWAVSLAVGENRFAAAFGAAEDRLGKLPTEGLPAGLPLALAGIPANLSVFFGSRERLDAGRVLLGLLLWAVVIVGCLGLRKAPLPGRAGGAAILFLGSLVLARYVLLGNHSYLHQFFAYRALVSTVLAVLILPALGLRLGRRGGP